MDSLFGPHSPPSSKADHVPYLESRWMPSSPKFRPASLGDHMSAQELASKGHGSHNPEHRQGPYRSCPDNGRSGDNDSSGTTCIDSVDPNISMFSPPHHEKARVDSSQLPKGDCRYILLQPEAKRLRCACVGFALNQSITGSTCDCGHQA